MYGNLRMTENKDKGKYTYANEDIYLGEYKNDKKHGQGTFTWNNGNKYEGTMITEKETDKGLKLFLMAESM